MSDTLPETEAYLAKRYRQLTPGRRIEMACGMWTAAVEMARAGIRATNPTIAAGEERVRLLERLHGRELPQEFLEGIAARIRSAP